MATRNVLGKIAAVVSINTGSVRPTLNSTAKDVERFATTVRSRISSATRASGKAFDDIFTPLQKLQAALKAANQQPVDLKIQNSREIQQAVRAAEQIAKPLANARKEFGTLSQGVQASLLPVLQSAQKQATNLFDALSNGAKVSNTDLANTEARVQQLISAFSRAAQASQLIRGLGNGQELQFQNPEFVEQARRSAQLQQQASSLTASQLSGSSIVNLIGQQRAAADEAERLLAALDKVRTTRNGDAAAAQAAYSNQLAQLAGINDRIERQIALIQRAAAAEQSAASARSAAQQQVTAQRNSLASASAALTGGITPQVQDVNEVFSNLTSRAQQARAAVANAFRTPEAADLRNRLAQIAAEVGNIQDEYRTLSAQDPQRREILRWQDLEERVQAVNFRLGAVTSLANQAREALGGVADEFTEAQLQAQRLAAANERLVVDQQESQVLSNEGASSRRATPVPRSVFEEGFARQIRNELGPAITDQQRQFDVLRGSIVSVKGQLDTLPATVRSQFIPAIQQAEAEFQRLRALGPDATAEEIARAAREVDRLTQSANRARQALNIQSFRRFTDDLNTRQAVGELQALQQILGRIGAQAGGPAAQAYDRYAAALRRAVREGTTGLPEVRRRLEQLQVAAAQAAAATGRISFARALREIQRGGDIARGGFDKLSLAAQQAAFAVDDFFSVQGDFSQRIRAVQNNVTQLAFILGSTEGLFIALAASITAQAVVALTKLANNGRSTEDQVKSLNDALSRQKSILDELAQAYQRVADSIEDAGLSERDRQDASIRRQVEELRNQQRQARESRILSIDTDVAAARGDVARAERELGQTSTVGQRVRAQLDLNAAVDRLRQIERRAVENANQPVRNVRGAAIAGLEESVRAFLQDRLDRVTAGAVGGPGGGGGAGAVRQGAERENQRILEEARARFNLIGNSPEQIFQAIEDQIRQLNLDRAPDQVIVALEQLRERLVQTTRQIQADDFAASVSRAALRAGASLDLARENIQAAFGDIPSSLDGSVRVLSESIRRLQRQANEAADAGRPEAARAALDSISQTRQQISAILDATSALRRFAEALDTASQEAQRNLSSAQQAADEARAAYLGRSTPSTQRRRQQAEADLLRQRELASAVEQEIASARERFVRQADDARRVSLAEEADAAGRRVVELRRAFEIPRVRGTNLEVAEGLRRRGREDLAREVESINDRQDEITRALGLDTGNFWDGVREILEDGASEAVRGLIDSANRLAEIDSLLSTQGVLASGQRDDLVRERARIEQQAVEQDAAVRAAVDESTRDAQQRQQASRGSELALTPAQRAAESLANDIDAVRQFFGRQAEDGNGLVDFQAQQEAIDRLVSERARQTAPAIFGLADSVQNAVLQGPSRAALNVSDISTQEGARELNRLLRGEDSNRGNQNLVELQRQSQALDDLNAKVAALGARVGVA